LQCACSGGWTPYRRDQPKFELSPQASPNPAQERTRRDDGHHLVNGFAQLGSELQQSLAFLRCNRDPRRTLASQHLLFDLQMADLPGQFSLRYAGNHEQQTSERSRPLKSAAKGTGGLPPERGRAASLLEAARRRPARLAEGIASVRPASASPRNHFSVHNALASRTEEV